MLRIYRIPIRPFKPKGGLAQLARAPALQAGGQRFESVILHHRKEHIDILEGPYRMTVRRRIRVKTNTLATKYACGQPHGAKKRNQRKGDKGT